MSELLALDVFFAIAAQKYYANKDAFIGQKGDFITAPEASQMFCHGIGVWIYNTIQSFPNKMVSLVELGPGYGTLMNELVTFLKQDPTIHISDVFFIETSHKARVRQKQAVQNHHSVNFHWLDSIEQLPPAHQYILVANEFFDVMPVKQFIKIKSAFHEIFVQPDLTLRSGDDFISPTQMEKIMQYSNICPTDFNEGDLYEISTAALSTLGKICSLCKAGLIIDYGYYKPKKRNTIQSIAKHQILETSLPKPGEADISAQVDFGAMINFIRRHYQRFAVRYCSQKEFLMQNHIETIAHKAKSHAKTSRELHLINEELEKILIDMGELFQVLEIKG